MNCHAAYSQLLASKERFEELYGKPIKTEKLGNLPNFPAIVYQKGEYQIVALFKDDEAFIIRFAYADTHKALNEFEVNSFLKENSGDSPFERVSEINRAGQIYPDKERDWKWLWRTKDGERRAMWNQTMRWLEIENIPDADKEFEKRIENTAETQ